MPLTHVDETGRVQMVDVGEKPDTERVAVAKGEVAMRPETLRLITEGGVPKGDVLTTAQIAGVMAAKRTPDLIPMCHPLLLTKVDIEFTIDEKASRIEVTATVRWTSTLRFLLDEGVEALVEVGPGKVLTGLARRVSRDWKLLQVEDPDGLEKVLGEVS